LIGLVPGIGDLIGALISTLIVMRAVQAGVPRIAVARMMTNIYRYLRRLDTHRGRCV